MGLVPRWRLEGRGRKKKSQVCEDNFLLVFLFFLMEMYHPSSFWCNAGDILEFYSKIQSKMWESLDRWHAEHTQRDQAKITKWMQVEEKTAVQSQTKLQTNKQTKKQFETNDLIASILFFLKHQRSNKTSTKGRGKNRWRGLRGPQRKSLKLKTKVLLSPEGTQESVFWPTWLSSSR